MTRDDFWRIVDKEGLDGASVDLNSGSHDRLTLTDQGAWWEISFTERNMKSVLGYFGTESDALDKLLQLLRSRQS